MDQLAELRSLVARVRRRWFALAALRTAGRATAAAALPVLVAAALVHVTRPADGPLVLLMIVAALFAAAAAAVPWWRMQRRPGDRQMARFIEERAQTLAGDRSFGDTLVTAIDVADSSYDRRPGAFLPLLVGEALRRLRAVDPADLIPAPSIRRAAAQAIGGAALLAVVLFASAPAFKAAAQAARLRWFPGSVRVEVFPGDVRVPAGQPVRLRTVLHGSSGTLKDSLPTLNVTASGQHVSIPMVQTGDAFEYLVQSVDRTFTYSVSAGSARSGNYTVTALFPPRVNRIDLHYAYPSFAGLPPRDEQDGGDIYAPAGTRVRLRIHTDKPIARGEIAFGGGAPLAARPAGDRMVEADVALSKDDSYRVRVADADGLQSSGDSEYFIRLMDDRPPDVRILRPSSDQQITPLEEVAIEARADDDYGIAAFDLVYAIGGGAERTLKFDRVSGTDVQKVGTRLLPAEALGVKPGDVITYYARARDVGRGKRPTQATSDIFFLEVKPFNEEFVAAQSQAGGGASGGQIDSLVEAQKQIIASTWNVERRSQAGRSADDVKAIAEAQAELKTRAEQMASRPGRRRSRMPPPQRSMDPQRGAQSDSDPISAAVDAMAKAVQHLATERTKEALPHEMAALNGLLQVQAEVRRSQVSQQSNGAGGGGSNRSGQDLSALFDRELQRQQRTNYETQTAVETRPEQSDSNASALDHIRDLAKRQEDLSRRQREAAQSGLSAEELERELEKLTREQTELRERAEALVQRMGRQGQDAGQPRQSPRNGETTPGDLRQASEEMGTAANQLRRDDPNAAARSGERAAERLRRLETQMRGSSEAAKQRARADVRLDAQQIAQDQRRIAGEAARLDGSSGEPASDARRRLSEEKDRLAGRVDELERSIRQLAHDGAGGSAATAATDGARELERGRIADRMRESAKQMRDSASAGAGTAQREQELAQALDRVAGMLDSSASPEVRQLSEELDRTRAIRERLQRLEQQMREAEARDASAAGTKAGAAQQGRAGQGGRGGAGNGGGELKRLQEEYRRELERAQQAIGRSSGGQATSGSAGTTPEQEEFSRSAPGTEAFKQDRSGWESLRKDLDVALEQYEARVSDRLARTRSEDRFSAGGSERVPEGYRRVIARYFESLAKVKK